MNWEDIRAALEAIVSQLVSAVTLIVLVGLLYLLASRALGTVQRKRGLAEEIVGYIRRILRWSAVFAAVFLLLLQSFGLLQDAWAMPTAMVAMVAIGFVAVWSVLSNILRSLILLTARPFRVGDQIELPSDNVEGRVVNFSMLFTTLRAENGAQIQIPNNLFFQRVILRREGSSQVGLDEQLLREGDAKV